MILLLALGLLAWGGLHAWDAAQGARGGAQELQWTGKAGSGMIQAAGAMNPFSKAAKAAAEQRR
ncbi:hypothetical protein [Sagittula stellata]|nr:hypothetical protein [Sagittula stellata]